MEIGLRGGIKAATIAWSTSPLGDEPAALERRRLFSGGMLVAFNATERLKLRLEVLHSGKGFREVQDDGDITVLDLDYLEIPLLVGLMLGSSSSAVRSEVYAGPWLSWETSCTASVELTGQDLSFPCNDVPDDPVLRRTTDWGVTAGFAVSFDAPGPLRAFLDARYTAGLHNIDAAPDIDNLNVRHRGYGLSAGLILPVGS